MNILSPVSSVAAQALPAVFQSGAGLGVVPPSVAASAGTFFADAATPHAGVSPDSTASSARRFAGPLMSAGIFTNDVQFGLIGRPLSDWSAEVALVLIAGVAVLIGLVINDRRTNSGYRLARKYFGEEFDQAVETLRTCETSYSGCAGDDVKLLIRSARLIDHILKLPQDQKTKEIDKLIEQWNRYGYGSLAGCYAIYFHVGIPARVIEVLSRIDKTAFTREQYEKLRQVGVPDASGIASIPMSGQRLMNAANNLRIWFEDINATPHMPQGD